MLQAYAQLLDSSPEWPGRQSALQPASQGAAAVDHLGVVMFIGALVIFLLVMALLTISLLPRAPLRRRIRERRFVVAFGIYFTLAVLSSLLVYGLVIARDLRAGEPPLLRVEVIGEQWWWRVHYLDRDNNVVLATANEIHIPAGARVELVLRSADVIHSFWVPALAGKLDMIPGRTNILTLDAAAPGVHRGQCAEFCGGQHALMAFHVVVLAKGDFEAWWGRAVAAATEPIGELAQRGRALFVDSGCGACHVVRGTEANGSIGPDLTHVGSRASIGAGLLPTNVGTLAGWIASSQHLKPDNRMPSFNMLTGLELRAIATYLDRLK